MLLCKNYMHNKVLNKHRDTIPSDAVYVGRGSKWGNPYRIGEHGNREEVIKLYEQYLNSNPELVKEAKKRLKGKSLWCFCAPKPCHADILLKIAN